MGHESHFSFPKETGPKNEKRKEKQNQKTGP
jgi:hypothetical protein